MKRFTDVIMQKDKKDWSGSKIKRPVQTQGSQGCPSPAQGEL